MKLLSSRFAAALFALYALAAATILIHTFGEPAHDDCAEPSALPRWDSPDDEGGRLLRDRFGAFQWSEGSFEAGEALFSYVFLRSYTVAQLLNRPENALLQKPPERRAVEWIEADSGAVPVHRPIFEPRADRATRTLAGYLLLFDGKPLAQPAFAQLWSAPKELLFGRSPMTLLFIQGRVPRDEYPRAELELRVRLLEALSQYQQACRARPAGGGSGQARRP